MNTTVKFQSYRGLRRTEYLEMMYNALIDCARYNRKFYEDFMNARVLDVGHNDKQLVFKVEIKGNMEIYATIMRQLSKYIKDAKVILVEPKMV